MKIAALLLAAGESRRMRSPKPLLEWFGQPLVIYQVNQLLAGGASEVLVVVGPGAEALYPWLEGRRNVRGVLNPDYRKGRSSSVKAGILNVSADTDGVLVLGVDQPRPDWIHRRLLDSHMRIRPLLSIPVRNSKRGHPPIFSRDLFSEVLEIEESGQGLKRVVRDHLDDTNLVEIDSPLIHLDLNTSSDYKVALQTYQP